MLEWSRAGPPLLLMHGFGHVARIRDASAEPLGRVRCPTLVIRGEHSPMLSAATVDRMVNQVLADGRATLVSGAGHAVMLDAPEAFAAALYPFLGA